MGELRDSSLVVTQECQRSILELKPEGLLAMCEEGMFSRGQVIRTLWEADQGEKLGAFMYQYKDERAQGDSRPLWVADVRAVGKDMRDEGMDDVTRNSFYGDIMQITRELGINLV
jgi:hypothetical protein